MMRVTREKKSLRASATWKAATTIRRLLTTIHLDPLIRYDRHGRNKEVINIHAEWENGTRGCVGKSSKKCALTLHTCISTTDRVKINEQNK